MSRPRHRIRVFALVTIAALLGLGLTTGVAADAARTTTKKVTAEELAFHDAMRKLWEDHITWTRMFIVEFAAGSAATQPTLDRLLQNQVDIGDAIQPFYGQAAGDRLTELLTDHILVAGDILSAAKAGDQDAVDEAVARWYANADDIAMFLAAANPSNWPFDEMRAMLRDHLDLTLAEAVARLQGRFEADIAAYEDVHVQALEMADMLSAGIIDQFPGAFR